jgi:hypothetical protein
MDAMRSMSMRCDVNEERKYQVVEGHSFPGLVLQLAGQEIDRPALADLAQGVDDVLGPDNPEHVEAAQGVK